MRVIGGELKGRNLAFRKDRGLRPTKNIVREAIFDILGGAAAKRILDVFAGTGANGIESLSRGADFAVFVENSPGCLKLLRGNLKSLGLEKKALVLPVSAETALQRLADRNEKFDVILADPPYSRDRTDSERLLDKIGTCLNEGGTAVMETAAGTLLPQTAGGLRLLKERKYGAAKLGIYRKI